MPGNGDVTRHLRFLTHALFAVGLAVLLSGFGGTAQAKKIALVIGNAAYPGTEIPVARQNAVGIARVLKRDGFNVELRHDLSAPALQNAIQRFAARAASDRVDLLFQRAAQNDGKAAILPVGAAKTGQTLSPLLAPKSQGTHLIILDAKRP